MVRNLIPWRRRAEPVKVEKAENPFEALHRRMNELFDEFFSDFGGPRWLAPRGASSVWGGFTPRFEVAETDDAVEVTAELPGLDEKDVRVTLDNGVLTVEGEKKSEREEKRRGVFFSELSYGRFQRSVALPAGVDESKVKAVFKKGVLRVTVPKTEAARGARRSIHIETE